MSFEVVEDDLSSPAARALARHHLAEMQASTPPGHAFALDVDALKGPGITLYTVREDGEVIAMGALKQLGPGHAELKAMRTHPAHLRRGAAAVLLDRLVEMARAQGLRRLSLETGTSDLFAPALALYRGRGFTDGPAFADYPPDSPHNCYLHLDLQVGTAPV